MLSAPCCPGKFVNKRSPEKSLESFSETILNRIERQDYRKIETDRTMAAAAKTNLKVYVGWVNSVLVEARGSVRSWTDLQDPTVLASLTDTLWPSANLTAKCKTAEDQSTEGQVSVLLTYLHGLNIKHTVSAAAVAECNAIHIHQLVWTLIINFGIHSPKVHSFQRNSKMGCRLALNWCREVLPTFAANHMDSLVNNLTTDGLLIDVITELCPSAKHDPNPITHMDNCLKAAERELKVKPFISAEAVIDHSIEEEHLLMYVCLLRRKVRQKSGLPALPGLPKRATLSPPPSHRALTDSSKAKLAWTL